MILCDAGPLLALVDHRDPKHELCSSTLETIRSSLVTTWPCFTEAMYFLGKAGGWVLQRELWAYRSLPLLHLQELNEADEGRIQILMAQYHDTPMDLADASLVAIAERINIRTVFTLDSDFRIYRTQDGGAFEIVPE